MGDLLEVLGKLGCCWRGVSEASRGCSPCGLCASLHPSIVTGTLYCQKAPSFGWDVKPRSWLSVVIKNPMALLVKSRGVSRCTGQIPTTGSCQSWPPNNPHPRDWLYDSLSSPSVADVWWAHWRRCPVAAVASSKWMLHTGGGWGETPPPPPPTHTHTWLQRALGVWQYTIKRYYKCIHSMERKDSLVIELLI